MTATSSNNVSIQLAFIEHSTWPVRGSKAMTSVFEGSQLSGSADLLSDPRSGVVKEPVKLHTNATKSTAKTSSAQEFLGDSEYQVEGAADPFCCLVTSASFNEARNEKGPPTCPPSITIVSTATNYQKYLAS